VSNGLLGCKEFPKEIIFWFGLMDGLLGHIELSNGALVVHWNVFKDIFINVLDNSLGDFQI